MGPLKSSQRRSSAHYWAWRHITPSWRHTAKMMSWGREGHAQHLTDLAPAADALYRHKPGLSLVTKPLMQTRPAVLLAKPRRGSAAAGRGLWRERPLGTPSGPGGTAADPAGPRRGRGAGRTRSRSRQGPADPALTIAPRSATSPSGRRDGRKRAPCALNTPGRGHNLHWLAAPWMSRLAYLAGGGRDRRADAAVIG